MNSELSSNPAPPPKVKRFKFSNEKYNYTSLSHYLFSLFYFIFRTVLFYRQEREKYYYHRGKAKDALTGKNCMCLIIDGMDQNKLLLPALLNQAKSYASAWRLKTHLTGFPYK